MIQLEMKCQQLVLTVNGEVIQTQPVNLDAPLEDALAQANRTVDVVRVLVTETTREAWRRDLLDRTNGFHR